MGAYSSVRTIPLKGSASLQYNNLSHDANSERFTYVRKAEVVLVTDDSSRTGGKRLEDQALSKPEKFQSRFLTVGGVPLLVVASGTDVTIWNAVGTLKLFTWNCPAAESEGASPGCCVTRGITQAVTPDGEHHICVGTELGTVEVFCVEGPRINHAASVDTGMCSISSLQSDTSGDASRIIAADDAGAIQVLQAAVEAYNTVCAMRTPDNTPCVSLAARGGDFLAGLSDGRVLVYSGVSTTPHTIIKAHSRFLSAIALHPTKNLLATCAEDATVAVWRVPLGDGSGDGVECLLSDCWMHRMLTGVTFCGDQNDDVAVAAYDTGDLRVYCCSTPSK